MTQQTCSIDDGGELYAATQLACPAPYDQYNLTYMLFFLQGFTVLLTFNAFIKNLLFPFVFQNSSYGTSYSTTLTFAFMITTLLAALFLVLVPSKFKMEPTAFILTSLAANGIILLISSVLSIFFTSISVDALFVAMVVLASFGGLFTGFLQNSLFGFASNFPPVYFQALNSGQGLAGLLSSLSMMSMESSSTDLIDKSPHVASASFVYFFIAFLLMLASFMAFYFFLRKNTLFKYYYVDPSKELLKPPMPDLPDNEPTPSDKGTLDQLKKIFTNAPSMYYPFAIAYVFIVTFAVFPTFFIQVTSASDPTDPALADYRKLFFTISFLLFDISDVIGKFLPGIPLFFVNSHTVSLLTSLLRTIFIPLFMWSNFPHKFGDKEPFYPGALRLIRSDGLFFFIVFMFGLSNGYFGSLLLMKAASSIPSKISNVSIREKMGKTMSLFLGFGLAIGPLICYVLIAVLSRSNPFN